MTEVTELDTLKERATKMGITFHPSIGLDKLKEKVNGALASDTPENPVEELTGAPTGTKEETRNQRNNRLKKEAKKLIRVNIVNMNPAKKDWEGETFTTGNNLVGTIKRFVPFNTDNGWHIEQMLYNMLKERKCQVFHAKKDNRGREEKVGKLINEFAIEVLPPLTQRELDELAKRQAATRSIED